MTARVHARARRRPARPTRSDHWADGLRATAPGFSEPAGTLATVQKAPRELTTNRLTLRPPGRGDRSLWVAAAPRPGACTSTRSTRCRAPTRPRRAGFTDCLDRWESAGFDYGVVEETSTRTGIGVGGLRRQRDDRGEQVLNLYYRLAAPVHGRGLATEAARAWTAHALEWLPDLPVVVTSRVANLAAVQHRPRRGAAEGRRLRRRR